MIFTEIPNAKYMNKEKKIILNINHLHICKKYHNKYTVLFKLPKACELFISYMYYETYM